METAECPNATIETSVDTTAWPGVQSDKLRLTVYVISSECFEGSEKDTFMETL